MLRLAFLIWMSLWSVASLALSIEPEEIYEQNVAHYQTGYYSKLGADFSSEAHSEDGGVNAATREIDETNNATLEDSKLGISDNKYSLSDLEKNGLEKLFAKEAQKYRACVDRGEQNCYSDEVFNFLFLLGIYDVSYQSKRSRFGVSSLERRFLSAGNGVYYQQVLYIFKDGKILADESCMQGDLKQPRTAWISSDTNCDSFRAWGESARGRYSVSALTDSYEDIPWRIKFSQLRTSFRSIEYYQTQNNSPCSLIGTVRCAKANRLAKNSDWMGLKTLAEQYESTSYLWVYYKSLAEINLGEAETARNGLVELLTLLPVSGAFNANIEWERFVKSSASLLVSYYYAKGDYQSAIDCCHVMGNDTSDLEGQDRLILSAQLMRASAMTLIESPRIATAVSILFELRKTLDRLNLPQDARIRLNVDQQLTHLRQQLEAIGRGGATL